MLFVVSFHCSFESSKSAVNFFVNGNVNFGRSSPKNNDTVATVFSLEFADVFANLVGHVPTVGAGLHVFAIKTLSVIVVESGLHRNDLFKFVLNGVDVFFLEDFAVDSAFVSVSRINIPSAENDVVEVSDRNYFVVFEIFLFSALSNTDLSY